VNEQRITEILVKPFAQHLLIGTDPVRLAYDGFHGDPRVVQIGFWTKETGS
jgi:hypothetical protein